MKILILGGTGYIGSRLYLFLKNKGYVVDTLDLEIYGNFVNEENLALDIRTFDLEILKKYGCIINLCGSSSVRSCECNIEDVFANNVFPLVRMLPFLKDKIFINASSSSVYGAAFKGRAREEDDLKSSINYYDFYKKFNDEILKLSGIPHYYSLRFGTVCGGSPNLRNDIMINAMYDTYQKEGVVKVYNGKTRRPILFIRDLCYFVENIIVLNDVRRAGIYNLASFNSTSYDIAKKTASHLQCDLIDCDKDKISNVKMSTSSYDFWVDTSKLHMEFDFVSKHGVVEILEDLENYDILNRDNRNQKIGRTHVL